MPISANPRPAVKFVMPSSKEVMAESEQHSRATIALAFACYEHWVHKKQSSNFSSSILIPIRVGFSRIRLRFSTCLVPFVTTFEPRLNRIQKFFRAASNQEAAKHKFGLYRIVSIVGAAQRKTGDFGTPLDFSLSLDAAGITADSSCGSVFCTGLAYKLSNTYRLLRL